MTVLFLCKSPTKQSFMLFVRIFRIWNQRNSFCCFVETCNTPLRMKIKVFTVTPYLFQEALLGVLIKSIQFFQHHDLARDLMGDFDCLTKEPFPQHGPGYKVTGTEHAVGFRHSTEGLGTTDVNTLLSGTRHRGRGLTSSTYMAVPVLQCINNILIFKYLLI